MRRKIVTGLTALGLSCITLFATGGSASSHGQTTAPVSRQQLCYQHTVRNCGQIQWEPWSVEGQKGFPTRGPADGHLCSGGIGRFGELDNMRGGAWPATSLRSGQSYDFVWRLDTPHATSKFHYYITRDGWDPTAPLTRAALEPAPFLTVQYGGRMPTRSTIHPGTIPAGKSGRHLILAVWDVYDTANAFYACSDVQLG
ncbi:GlcNAc-binding protein A [Streptomyces sp. RB5]|uniref:GlcNAc-binding protein A n=1 Tax=Streptomyces smaragdinus TaxID=2585196 RepID=A0A7K0CAL6_9ACTN|nr:lytic polysaccharide monooxygenase auxiliary activity family 9 protein [Streptomyces smaragdinus]MQY10458.1 GlcNAc-binding protein A [Streptomyces smaragdinus]